MDRSQWDRSTQSGSDLGARTVRSAAIAFVAKIGYQIISMSFAVILARLLCPSDFGLFSMTSSIAMFFWLISRMGLAQATIQKQQLTQAQVSGLFWTNLGFAAAMSLVIVATAPLVGLFYRNPEATRLSLLLAGVPILEALAAQHSALLMRRMAFGRFALVLLASVMVGGWASVAASQWGWGAYALGLRILVTLTVVVAGTWLAQPWWPGKPDWGGIPDMLRFGGYLTGCTLVGYVALSMDRILIGRFFGQEPAGFYDRALTLMNLSSVVLIEPLDGVMLSAFSKIQSDPNRLQREFQRLLAFLGSVNAPLAAGLFLCAPDVILLLFGPQWQPAIPLLRWLSVVAFFQPLSFTVRWLYLPTGRSDRLFAWQACYAILLCLAFIAGIHYGALGIAVAYAMASAILLPAGLYGATRSSSLRLRPLLMSLSKLPVLVLAMGGAVAWVDRSLDPSFLPWGRLLIKASVGAAVYSGLFLLFCRSEVWAMVEIGRVALRRVPEGPQG